MRKVYPINSVYISYAALATSTLVKQYWIYSKQLLCIWKKTSFQIQAIFFKSSTMSQTWNWTLSPQNLTLGPLYKIYT